MAEADVGQLVLDIRSSILRSESLDFRLVLMSFLGVWRMSFLLCSLSLALGSTME